jgi:hypothetical protein
MGEPAKAKVIPRGAVLRPGPLEIEIRKNDSTLQTRQLWEGTVTELCNGGFTAILSDKTNPSNPDEQATFDNAEISPDDQPLVGPGSSFYWIIGSERTAGGQVKNVSMVQFRRLPAWTDRKLSDVAVRARQLRASIRRQP